VCLMTPPVFILGRASYSTGRKTMIFSFYNVLGKPLMQCFASVGMANIS